MDRKWLSNRIRQACEVYAAGDHTTERLDAVDDAYTHAIHERLQADDDKRAEEALRKIEKLLKEAEKDVVWEGEAIASHNDYSALREEHTVLRIIGHGGVAIRGEHFCSDEEQVIVTVRRKGRPPG